MRIIIEALKIKYDLDIKNKLTLITDLSATGKTTMLNLITDANNKNGISQIKSDKSCYVLDSNLLENKELLLKEAFFFIDEDMEFIKTYEFYKNILLSKGYFIIIGRNPETFINYPVEAIKIMESDENFKFYLEDKFIPNELCYKYNKEILNLIINEDSGSGFDFYDKITTIENKTSKGNKNIIKEVENYKNGIVIVDSLGYGKYINSLINKIESNNYKIQFILQKSFEYVILNSGILGIDLNKLKELESKLNLENISIEKIISEILIENTSKEVQKRYKKGKLNEWYFREENINKIVKQIIEDIGFDLNPYLNNKNQTISWGL